ncbi:uncharacterized protein LOC135490656 [Lineus longissimus]|uniref:uncharacterized protein LOC135490656 n=1 Tax=Lineus longissimus TaxID=88925 RepID=UPI002B4CF293
MLPACLCIESLFSLFQRWVQAFQNGRFLVQVRTNNGLERQNKLFKHTYLKHYSEKSLSKMLTTLIKEFLPERLEHLSNLKSYIDMNSVSSSEYRGYKEDVLPRFLHERPKQFIEHCKKRYTNSSGVGDQPSEPGKFRVISEDGRNCYEVNHGMDSESPSCTCPDFALTFWPCKHFFAIWNADKGYAWNSLPAWYMNSPFLSIDNHVIFRSKEEVAAVSESV